MSRCRKVSVKNISNTFRILYYEEMNLGLFSMEASLYFEIELKINRLPKVD